MPIRNDTHFPPVIITGTERVGAVHVKAGNGEYMMRIDVYSWQRAAGCYQFIVKVVFGFFIKYRLGRCCCVSSREDMDHEDDDRKSMCVIPQYEGLCSRCSFDIGICGLVRG